MTALSPTMPSGGRAQKRNPSTTLKKVDYDMYVSACRETSKFILAIVEDTWIRDLRDPDIFYAAVLPRDLLDHLQLLWGGLRALNVLALQNDMQRFHLDAKSMPKYINALEDARNSPGGRTTTLPTPSSSSWPPTLCSPHSASREPTNAGTNRPSRRAMSWLGRFFLPSVCWLTGSAGWQAWRWLP